MVTDRASAQGNSQRGKVADNLKDKVNKSAANDRVDVIVQSGSPWSSTLDSAVTGNGASISRSYTNFSNMRAVNLPASAVNNLANRSDVAFASLDSPVKVMGHISSTSGADNVRAQGTYTLDGTGIGIAILDSGIDKNHQSFDASRLAANVDFTGENRTDDPYGHGTHVAAAAAGNDKVSAGAYVGTAPGAKLINLRVLNSQGTGTVSALLGAMDWVMTNRATYNIRVVNMSLGTTASASYRDDPLCQAVRRLVDAGVVVVAAAGNEGKDASGNKVYGQIHSPGIEPSAITVGALNTYGTNTRVDDTVTTYSSRGPTRSYWTDGSGVKHYDNLIKPDVVAPGNKIIDAEAAGNYLASTYPYLDANVSGSASREQMYLNGTSMATPVVAGTAALMLQANPSLTPNLVKALIMYSAQQLPGFNAFEQGAGQVNIDGAIKLAKLVRTDLSSSTAVGTSMLTGAAPNPQSTIDGYTFTWAQGIIMDQTYATGSNLITNYQKIYGLGVLLADGTILSNGVLLSDSTLMSSGVLLGDNIMTSAGVLLGDGTVFCSDGVLLGDGVLLSDGVLLGDGVLISDGALISDGVLLADGTTAAQGIMANGDNTSGMLPVVDLTPNAPSGLTATAYSTTQINLAWSDNSDNESGFKIQRSSDGVTFTQIATVSAGVKTYSSTGLLKATKYYYRVSAYNSSATSTYSNVAYATTKSR